MKRLSFLALLLASASLVSCSSTSQISLDYVAAPGHIQPGQPEFTTRLFRDQRSTHPLQLGTVRTQIGTPVEQVQLRIPAAEVVTNAFGHGLQARGMLTSARQARYIVTGEVLDLYCQLLVHPYGFARIRVTVLDASTGQILYSQVHTGERQGRAYVPGSGSPVPQLNDLTSGALQDAVDQALDDPNLRRQTGGSGPRPRSGYEPGML